MKFSKLIISLFVLTATLSTLTIPIGVAGEETGYTSPLNFFQIEGDINFTAYVVAPLSWELNKPVNLTLYINVTVLPEGSSMSIVNLSYSYNLPNSSYPIYQTSSTPNVMVTEANQQVVDRVTLYAPSDVERFNITIEIIANSSSSPENQEFEIEFPGDYPYIEVAGEENDYTSPTNFFQIEGDINFTTYAVAPLSWELNKPVNLTLYINVTILPEGSSMSIVSLSYRYNLPNSPYPIYQPTSIPNVKVTEANQQVVDRKTLLAPSDVEGFNITIKVIANSSSSPDNQEFEMEFPGDLPYIEVEDTSANPIINLPGFPESRTFWRWILIFFVAMIIMTLPASCVAFMKIQQNLKSRKKKGVKKK